KAHDSGTIAFDASRAHLYKLEPGTSVPGEVIVVGPITYTNANVQAALNSPGVRPWTKLDTRKLPARLRRSRPDELAHVVAPVFLASGARKVRLARTVADGAVYWARIDPALVARRVPAAERTIVSTALRGDYPRRQFNAKFWLDAHGRIRRVIVAYATARGTPVAIDTSYSGFGARVAVKPPPANRVTDIHTALTRSSRSHARPAASTTSSRGAISCRSPIASAAQPMTLKGRRNAVTARRTSRSSQSTGGTSMPSAGATYRSTGGLYRRQTATASRACSTSAGSTSCASSSFLRTLSP